MEKLYRIKRKDIEGDALSELFGLEFEDLDFTGHALMRMKERDFSFEDIVRILRRPLKITRITNLKHRHRWSFTVKRKKVVVDMEFKTVVTVMRIRKTKKIKSDAKERHERSMAHPKRSKNNFTQQFARGRFQEN